MTIFRQRLLESPIRMRYSEILSARLSGGPPEVSHSSITSSPSNFLTPTRMKIWEADLMGAGIIFKKTGFLYLKLKAL
jgi:hypothetical protein